MATTKPKDIDEYIDGFPKETQKRLEQVRATIKKAAPAATEAISYSIPAFNLNGRYLCYFAGFKNHIGLYPIPTGVKELEKAYSSYKTSGKGTIQFPLDKPLPTGLIAKIIKYMAKRNTEKTKSKSTVKTKKASGEKYIKYHNDGSVWAKGTMVGDQPDGYWEWYRKGGGAIMRSGYFSKGKQVGEWTTYDKKGKVFKVTRMKSPA